jgi:hypothetical protein
VRPPRHPGGPFASAGEGRGAPSDPAVRDQAVSARPGVPSGVLLSRFPRAARESNPADRGGRDPRGRPGHSARSTRGCRRRGPRARRFPRRRAPAVLVGAGLSAADDPFQHGQDALRGTLNDPDVRSLGPSSRRGLGDARGVAGELPAVVHQLGPRRLGPAETRQATGLDRAGARCGESTRDVAATHTKAGRRARPGGCRVAGGVERAGAGGGGDPRRRVGRSRRPGRAWAHAQRGGGWDRGRGGRGPRRGRPWLGDGGPARDGAWRPVRGLASGDRSVCPRQWSGGSVSTLVGTGAGSPIGTRCGRARGSSRTLFDY